MLTFTKEKNPSEFLVEQRAKSNEQRGKSNEQRAESFYLVTFKVRKFDSLFYKLNACLQRTTTCIGLQAEQIFSIYMFLVLGVAFAALFLCYFQKLQLFVIQKFWNNFCCIVLLFASTQKVCFRFLRSYFKLKILITLSFVVSFLVDMFN